MSTFYLDTSAAVKLLVEEDESLALAGFYDANLDASWVSSALLEIELVRTLRRSAPGALAHADELLAAVQRLRMDDGIVAAARDERDPALRSLDAIHLASARALGSDLTAVVTYDERLARAATTAGLPVLSPA